MQPEADTLDIQQRRIDESNGAKLNKLVVSNTGQPFQNVMYIAVSSIYAMSANKIRRCRMYVLTEQRKELERDNDYNRSL